MGGYQDDDRWVDPDGTSHTVNSTNDPNVPGGYYYNQHGPECGGESRLGRSAAPRPGLV